MREEYGISFYNLRLTSKTTQTNSLRRIPLSFAFAISYKSRFFDFYEIIYSSYPSARTVTRSNIVFFICIISHSHVTHRSVYICTILYKRVTPPCFFTVQSCTQCASTYSSTKASDEFKIRHKSRKSTVHWSILRFSCRWLYSRKT